MKKLLFASFGLAAGVTLCHGQGTVLFQNITPVNAPVFCNGVRVAGDAFLAQLWAAAPGGTLQAVGAATPFLTGTSGAGFFIGGSRVIDAVAPGTAAQIQLRAWQVNDGGVVANTWQEAAARGRGLGQSAIITVATGGGGDPPAPPVQLTGLTGFDICFVPEPSTIALGVVGGLGTLLMVRRRK